MLIEKEDAIKAICEACYMYKYIGEHYRDCKYYPCDDVTALEAVPEAPSGDLISRADAIRTVASITMSIHLSDVICDKLLALPSAEAESDDLIIKGEKGIQDGLYNIQDGKLFKYKAKGGTVRTYEIVPSAEAVQGDGKMIPIELKKRYPHSRDEDITDAFMRGYQAHAEAVQGWIPCSESLPKINQRVLLATNEGRVFVGYKEKPELVWRVTDADGREHWVYDPENYTDDIDVLLKEDDCSFSQDNQYSDGFMSVTSINYDDRFEGVTAWMPLPKPYKGGDDE